MSEEDSKTKIRRTGRSVSDDNWIREFLKAAPYGTLATAEGDQPFLNINTFAYDESENAIYLHGALKGRTRKNIESNEKVCFGTARIGRFLPAETAFGFSVEYESVIVFGKCHIVATAEERRKGLDTLMNKYFPKFKSGVDFEPISKRDLEITSVYKLVIEEWSGKRKAEDAGFPKAFLFEDRFDQ